MDSLRPLLSKLAHVIRNGKKQIFATLLLAVFFFVMIFPYEDLSDLLTAQVAQATNNQIYLQFEDLGIGLLPPGVEMKSVSLDTPLFSTLRTESLSLSPSISSLIMGRPGFRASASGIFNGNIRVVHRTGRALSGEARAQELDFSANNLSLSQLSRFLSSPLQVEGTGSAQVAGEVDPTFVDQPSLELDVALNKLTTPPVFLANLMGLSLPGFSFEQIVFQGRLVGSELVIENGTIGAESDALSAQVQGRIATTLRMSNGQLTPNFGNYDLRVHLTLSNELDREFGGFLGPGLGLNPMESYKSATPNGSRYSFRLRGSNFQSPPAASPLTR